jgi:hypothetical protein
VLGEAGSGCAAADETSPVAWLMPEEVQRNGKAHGTVHPRLLS